MNPYKINMEDELSKVLLKTINEANEPLETKEVVEKVKEFVQDATRTKVVNRLSNLRGDGVIKGKFVGPGKGVWIWWRKGSI